MPPDPVGVELPVSTLLVEDDQTFADLVRRVLDGTARISHERALSPALERLERERFAAVVLDLNLPDSQGVSTVRTVHERFPGIPVVVLTGGDDYALGVEVVRAGAQDFVPKDAVRGELLCRVLRYAVERSALREKLEQAVLERETAAIEPAPAPVAARHYDGGSLREQAPEDFARFSAEYANLLHEAVEERFYRRAPEVTGHVRAMAEELGLRSARPRDVVDIHSAGLKAAIDAAPQTGRQVLIEEGRILVLSLMGRLAGYYRDYYPGRLGREKRSA